MSCTFLSSGLWVRIVVVEKEGELVLAAFPSDGRAPFCDGTHNML